MNPGAKVHDKSEISPGPCLERDTLDKAMSSMILPGWFFKSNYTTSEQDRVHFTGSQNVYYAMRPVIAAAMLLGLMPLTNATSSQLDHLRFRWFSPQTFFTLLLVSCMVLTFWMTAYYYAITSMKEWSIMADAVRNRETVFYISATVFLLMSIHTTQKLPEMLMEWDCAANRLKKYIRPSSDAAEKPNLHLRLTSALLLTAFFMTSAITEHVLHDVTIVDHTCINVTYLECYYSEGNDYFKHHFSYSLPMAIVVIVFNKFATLAWNFQDLFIALLGMALCANFKILSHHLKQHHKQINSSEEWKVIREDHIALCELVKKIDDVISHTVMLSYMVNIYFLCVQIFYSIRPSTRTLIKTAYFCSSFCHLIVRLCVVSFSSASFNDQALEPLYYLQRCPANSYCEEVSRFISHLSTCSVNFTGYKFFPVNRSIFLAIVSVVFTYELILLNVK